MFKSPRTANQATVDRLIMPLLVEANERSGHCFVGTVVNEEALASAIKAVVFFCRQCGCRRAHPLIVCSVCVEANKNNLRMMCQSEMVQVFECMSVTIGQLALTYCPAANRTPVVSKPFYEYHRPTIRELLERRSGANGRA